MASRIPDAWFDELRSRLNIVDVVSDYVALKQKGRRFWGLCPFHGEKTPSFSVDSEGQMYYCFGCHKGGNVIHFVMDMERMEFLDAVRMLAERARLSLPDRMDEPSDESRALRDQIFEANQAAARFYHDAIWTSEGAEVLSYLHRRGLDDAGIRRFGLGSTSQGGDSLTRHLTAQGFEFSLLQKAGLAAEKDGRRYDAFRNRAIFPIINPQGRVLGFGGRALGDAQPKYLNTSDTPVFNKRLGLYALNMVKKERGLEHLILVEGYMDVVSLRQHGVPGVVATLGTALTEEQARLIKRYAPEVWVCYDGDSAGQKAILRALDIFEQLDIPARVIDIPDAMDPDDYVKRYGAEGFMGLKPLAPAEYRILRAEDGIDMTEQEGRTRYAIAACAILRQVRNPVELENYLKTLSVKTGFAREVLVSQMGMSKTAPDAPKPKLTAHFKRAQPTPEYVRAEVGLMNLLADRQVDGSLINVDEVFVTPLYVRMARLIAAGESRASVLDRLSDEERNDAAQALQQEVDMESDKAAQAFSDYLHTINRHKLNQRYAEARQALDCETDPERKRELLSLMTRLNAELRLSGTCRKE